MSESPLAISGHDKTFTLMSENGERFQRSNAHYGTMKAIKTGCHFKTMPSPVGELTLVASDKGIAAILWENDAPGRVRLGEMMEHKEHPILLEAEQQLVSYFAGELKEFTVDLDFVSGTDFQKKVWHALVTIPFGETRSYAHIAMQVGHPTAVRAVGAANGRNPISIIVPCHRVIGSNGKLTGFAGGMEAKALLLNLER